jgi:acyl-coenzyme A thioesterase PaaI-like protein
MPFNSSLSTHFTNRWKLRLWMLRHLPMGLLTGMRIQSLEEGSCVVVLKERWWIRNPFGSVFWAVMGMAAELSTGALVYTHAGKEVKFILVGMEGTFFKKVKGKSYYFCQAGSDVLRIFERIQDAGDSGEVILPVMVKDAGDQLLAEFSFRWQLRKPMI